MTVGGSGIFPRISAGGAVLRPDMNGWLSPLPVLSGSGGEVTTMAQSQSKPLSFATFEEFLDW